MRGSLSLPSDREAFITPCIITPSDLRLSLSPPPDREVFSLPVPFRLWGVRVLHVCLFNGWSALWSFLYFYKFFMLFTNVLFFLKNLISLALCSSVHSAVVSQYFIKATELFMSEVSRGGTEFMVMSAWSDGSWFESHLGPFCVETSSIGKYTQTCM